MTLRQSIRERRLLLRHCTSFTVQSLPASVVVLILLAAIHIFLPLTVAAALAVVPTIDTSSKNPTVVVRLQAPHPDLTPAEQFQQLATICANRGIDEWDVYGDFHKTKRTTNDDDDDDYNTLNASFLRSFEADIATEFGKEDAVFMPSGVMAQSIALLIHHQDQQNRKDGVITNKGKYFACHPTSHLLLHENDGFQELCGFEAVSVQSPSSTVHPTGIGLDAPPMMFEHLQHMELDDISSLILELPHRELGGKVTPWEDILQMKQLLNENGVAFHCDGARIFEAATAGYQKTLLELAGPFDSVYISFYKGLGGMSGAMLLGKTDFCDKARVWLRRFGGNLFTLLPYVVSAWAGYQRQWKLQRILAADTDGELLSFSDKHKKLTEIVQQLTRSTNNAEEQTDFSKIARFEPSIPHVCMVHLYLRPNVEECNRIRDAVQAEHGVCIFHRLRSLEEGSSGFREGYRSMMEISVGEANGSIPNYVWVKAWSDFANRAVASLHTLAK